MVWSTRARCYEHDNCDCRPTKRQRLKSDSASIRNAVNVPSVSRVPSPSLSEPTDREHNVRRLPRLQLHSYREGRARVKPVPSEKKRRRKQTYRGCYAGPRAIQGKRNQVTALPQELETEAWKQWRTHAESGKERTDGSDRSGYAGISYGPSLQAELPPSLGFGITPPVSPRTPPEHVNQSHVNPNFGFQVKDAYELSLFRDGLRRSKYGSDIADYWKRGSTPEDVRDEWNVQAARNIAAAETLSDSE